MNIGRLTFVLLIAEFIAIGVSVFGFMIAEPHSRAEEIWNGSVVFSFWLIGTTTTLWIVMKISTWCIGKIFPDEPDTLYDSNYVYTRDMSGSSRNCGCSSSCGCH